MTGPTSTPTAFTDRVAVVTGAASGIVVLMDIDRDLLESRVEDLRSADHEAEGTVVDIVVPRSARRWAAA